MNLVILDKIQRKFAMLYVLNSYPGFNHFTVEFSIIMFPVIDPISFHLWYLDFSEVSIDLDHVRITSVYS